MAREDHGAAIRDEGLREGIDGLHVEVVARLVEHEHVGRAEQEPRQAEPGPLAAGQDGDSLLHGLAAKQHRTGHVEDPLRLRADGRLPFEVAEHRVTLGQARVDVLGVDADLAAVAPLHVARPRGKGIDERPQKRRLALAVVSHDGGPRAVDDFDVDPGGDDAAGIADREVTAADRRPLSRLHGRAGDRRSRLGSGELLDLESFEFLALRPGPRGRRRPGPVAGDEVLEVALPGEHRGIGPLGVEPPLGLIGKEGVDLARKHRQLAARKVERAVAGRHEKGAIMRHDEAGLVAVA